MTFKITIRGAGGPVLAEYECPIHGVFEARVPRDANGDPPDSQPCPQQDYIDASTMTMLGAPCGEASPWIISAPKMAVLSAKPTAVVRGGDMTDRPPWMLDTRPLAEGMSYAEWSKKQDALQRDRRHKELIEKGATQKKIIVS